MKSDRFLPFALALLTLLVTGAVQAVEPELDPIDTTYTTDTGVDITKIDYQAPGVVSKIMYPDGKEQSYQTFNYSGKAQQVLERLTANTTNGRLLGYDYNPDGNITNFYAPNSQEVAGSITQYRYNGFGERIAETAPETGTLKFTRDALGLPTALVDAKGTTTAITYDVLNRPTATTVTKSNATVAETLTYTYDAVKGLPASVQNAAGHVLSWTWNTEGDMTAQAQTIDGLTLTTKWEYNSAGKPIRHILPSGNWVEYSYNTQTGLLSSLKLQNPSHSTQQTILSAPRFAPFGDLQGWTWGNGYSRLEQRHLSGRTWKISDRHAEQLQYDAAGQITSRSDLNPSSQLVPIGSGDQYTYVYDIFDHLTTQTLVKNGTTTTQTHSWNQGDSRLDANTTFYAQTSPAPTQVTQQWLQQNNQTATYDANGNLIQLGQRGFGYNAMNQLTSVSDSSTVKGTYSYGPNGFRIKKVAGSQTRYFAYLPDGSLLGEYEKTSGGVLKVIQEHVYLAGKPVAVLDGASSTSLGVTTSAAYTSEALNQMRPLQEQKAAEEQAIAEAKSKLDLLIQHNTEFKRAIDHPFVYIPLEDLLIPVPITVNTAPHITNVQTAISNVIPILTEKYPTLGLHTQLQQVSATTVPLDAATLQTMRSQLVAASDARLQPINSSLTTIQSNGLSGNTVIGLTLNYVHTDVLGTPRKITKASDNALLWTWLQDEPFGGNQPTGSLTYNQRYPGQYYDAETGLHENRYRYYDPNTGRYLTPDPIGLAGGFHRYTYVAGNPVNAIDLLGLSPFAGIALAQNYLSLSKGDPDTAHSLAMSVRVARNWESRTPQGHDLRVAENYLTAYSAVFSGDKHWYGEIGAWGAYAFMTPGWQVLRGAENLLGENLHSPASFDALVAGYQGANDAFLTKQKRDQDNSCKPN